MGLHLAGFEVVGVDLASQPRYPFRFAQGDAVEFIRRYGSRFSAVDASPPCQRYSLTQRIRGNDHPDLIGPSRDALESTGRPWSIENVDRARPDLEDPVTLCGEMFGLRTYRHRLVEFGGGAHAVQPQHPAHPEPNTKMGRPVADGTYYHAVGNFSGVDLARQDMRVPWMNRDGIRECIPPVYGTWIGRQLLAAVKGQGS
jgi:DNA (cytosine-5)-methyltransferase 1